MTANDKKQLPAEHTEGEVQSNEQNNATSPEHKLDGTDTRVPQSRTTQKETGDLNTQTANIQISNGKCDLHSHSEVTGPQSELRKKKSSQNAIKFGIFSRATILPAESRSEYRRLLEGLWKSWQPKGEFEILQTEKLASISWRERRCLLAESAEIRKYAEFLEFDRRWVEQEEADGISQKRQAGGVDGFTLEPIPLIRRIRNPNVLERCVELLVEMRHSIETNGVRWDEHSSILQTIYGATPKALLRPTLYEEFLKYYGTKLPERERQSKGYANPEQCKKYVLRAIDLEIKCLKQYQEECESIESKRRNVEILRQNVPDSPRMDILIRYAAHLSREYARTVAELERAQRIRKGYPVLPPIKLEVSR